MIGVIMLTTIEQHRAALRSQGALTNGDEPDDDDDLERFILSCPLIPDEELIPLVEHAYVGYDLDVSREEGAFILHQFRQWAGHDDWIQAARWVTSRDDEATTIWRPADGEQPPWVTRTPSYLLLATSLLDQGRLLSEMRWRDFEELVGALLERDGWSVQVTPPSRDGGFDVVGVRTDRVVGTIRTIWQAKKYSSNNLVRLHHVRELSAIRDEQRATKGVVVTTSRLTRDAIAWIRRDQFRLGSMDHDALARWIRLQAAITAAGLSARRFAVDILDVDERNMRRWESGERELQGTVRVVCFAILDRPALAAELARARTKAAEHVVQMRGDSARPESGSSR